MRQTRARLSYESENEYEYSRIDSCQRSMLAFDLYKQPFRLLLPDGKSEYRSFFGALLSLATIGLLIAYCVSKVKILVGSDDDFKIHRFVEENYFLQTDRFAHEDGLVIAASITDTEETGGPKAIPPEYGALRIYRKSYESKKKPTFEEISTRYCDEDDFAKQEEDEETDAIFYPTMNTIADLEKYKDVFMCTKDSKDMYAHGNYETSSATAIMIVWERCDPDKNSQSEATKDIKCVDELTYRTWAEERYILAYENQKRFV